MIKLEKAVSYFSFEAQFTLMNLDYAEDWKFGGGKGKEVGFTVHQISWEKFSLIISIENNPHAETAATLCLRLAAEYAAG